MTVWLDVFFWFIAVSNEPGTLLLLLLLLFLTAVGLSPGGSSPTLVQTKIKVTRNNKTTTEEQNDTKQQNNSEQENTYKTVKLITQREHRKYKYAHITKPHTQTHNS